MANTTFSGAVRSENGYKTIIKNSSTGALTSDMTLSTYSTRPGNSSRTYLICSESDQLETEHVTVRA